MLSSSEPLRFEAYLKFMHYQAEEIDKISQFVRFASREHGAHERRHEARDGRASSSDDPRESKTCLEGKLSAGLIILSRSAGPCRAILTASRTILNPLILDKLTRMASATPSNTDTQTGVV